MAFDRRRGIPQGSKSSHAGLTARENEFWRVSGRDYVSGTQDLAVRVEPDPLEAALGFANQTAPVDWLEGVDRGATLEPPSLLEDQLARRLGAP